MPLAKMDRRLKAWRDAARLQRTGAFDAHWYLATYPDVAATPLTPLMHYVRKGAWEGRRPRPDFDPLHYLSVHADVAESGTEPFTHFILHGSSEARRTGPAAPAVTAVVERRRSLRSAPGALAFYGADPVLPDRLFPKERTVGPAFARAAGAATHAHTPAAPAPWFFRFAPLELVQERIATRTPRSDLPANTPRPLYSVLTVLDGLEDLARLPATAEGLAAICGTMGDAGRLEWIITGTASAAVTQSALPAALLGVTRILTQAAAPPATAHPVNAAAAAAQGTVFLVLAPGAVLATDALDILDHYFSAFPHCRYVGAPAEGPARPAPRFDSSELLTQNALAGGIVALRADLFDALGGYDARFAGAEAYDCALRAALAEPVLLIPEALVAASALPAAPLRHRAVTAVRMAILRRLVDETWPPVSAHAPALPRSRIARGLCLVRTQGRRPDLLAAALQSIFAQSEPLVAAVIVHGDAAAFAAVVDNAPREEGRVVFLHAPDTQRRRGHPWNVGLAHLAANADAYQYLCFLDDDDIYYPLFSQRIVDAFRLTDADVIYGLANQRPPGGAAMPAHMPLPTSCMVAGNFIPTNGYAVRSDVVLNAGIRLFEDIDYFEDWDFLLSLFKIGCRFHLIPEAVGEFLLIGDGNVPAKRNPNHYAACLMRLTALGQEAARQRGIGQFYRDLLAFDFDAAGARHPSPSGHLILAKKQFLRACAHP